MVRRALAWVLLLWLPIGLAIPAAAQEKVTAIGGLPPAAAWLQHFERDILPFWQTPSALGSPVGNFPTFRCNDGSLYDARSACAEYLTAPGWIGGALGRQYVRMMSRQVYLYGVAFHLTGDQRYLLWARSGVGYIIEHAYDNKTGDITSFWQDGRAESADRTSQDLAYDLLGLSFYYYMTRDPYVLEPLLRVEQYVRNNYFDPGLGLYRLALRGAEADHLDLVAQLDQANAYMLLVTPLLPQPYQDRWRAELAEIAKIIRERFYDRSSSFFVGTLAPAAGAKACIFDRRDTDFGHTIKAYWMLHFIARLVHDGALETFARDHAPGILRRAYLQTPGSWAAQPTCDAKSGGLNRASKWWMAAELDQAALTFGLNDRQTLRYIPATFDFWLKHMVDQKNGEVWDEIRLPDYAPQLPKVHHWKNGFHTAEHALVGYITTSAVAAEPVVLYYAFPGCRIPPDIRPYYYEGTVTAHAESPQQGLPGFCRVQVTFANIR
jgi:mannose/cellobiose epimerase-like protein (N-acyl-D-glucosamine 2-epimerase family)